MINNLEATLLGVIQGLTEFIPVSSTAHLKVIPALLGMPDRGAAYTAVIQLGTLVSLLIYFRRDIVDFVSASFKGIAQRKPFENQNSRMLWYLLIGTLPISLAGLLLSDYIRGPARSLYVIAGSLILLAVILFFADRFGKRTREIGDITWKDALWVGIGQAFALIPGASRSGTTLTAGLFLGLTREAAMRFSFLLSIPAIFLSGFYELIKEREELAQLGWSSVLIGMIVAAIAGYATVAGLLKYLKTHSTLVFIVYRIILGVALYYLLSSGWLKDDVILTFLF